MNYDTVYGYKLRCEKISRMKIKKSQKLIFRDAEIIRQEGRIIAAVVVWCLLLAEVVNYLHGSLPVQPSRKLPGNL